MDTDEHSRTLWSKLSSFFSGKEDNLEQAIMEARADGELKAEEGSMLLSILELDSMQVQEIMIPRTDIECVPLDSSIRAVAESIVTTGHSRLPVFDGTKDNIVGIVYAKDLLPFLIDSSQHEVCVNPLLRKAYFVPETKIASELLQEFRSRKNHLAIVVDEYGGTSGLITIEDLLEVIVGEIEDEHDTPKEQDITAITQNSYHILGRTFLEDLTEIGIHIESEEVDTIGGYLSLISGHVPFKDEKFKIEGWVFTVTDADAKQIKEIIAEKEVSVSED